MRYAPGRQAIRGFFFAEPEQSSGEIHGIRMVRLLILCHNLLTIHSIKQSIEGNS